MENKTINDPENYYKMAEPFENEEKANEALAGFYKDFSELRKKYKIRDVLIVTSDSIKNKDGEVGEFMQHSSYGNSLNTISLAAYAFGHAKAEMIEKQSKLLAGKVK